MEKGRTTPNGLAQLAAVIAGRCDVCGWQPNCECWGCFPQYRNEPVWVRCRACMAVVTATHRPTNAKDYT